MKDCVVTEFWKIKRYSVVKAGAVMTVLSVFMGFFYSTASTSEGWDFSYYIHRINQYQLHVFFPVIIMLMAVFLTARERTDDTLKSILTIPVSYRNLLTGKLILLLFLTVAFSLCNIVFAVAVNGFLGLPGMTVQTVAAAAGRIDILSNVLIYVAVLPLIVLNTFLLKSSVFGVAFAFVYGYLGTFEGRIMNWYPVKAAMILSDPYCGSGYDLGDFTYQAPSAAAVLAIFLLAAVLMLMVLSGRNGQTEVRGGKGRAVLKKGW